MQNIWFQTVGFDLVDVLLCWYCDKIWPRQELYAFSVANYFSLSITIYKFHSLQEMENAFEDDASSKIVELSDLRNENEDLKNALKIVSDEAEKIK